MHQRKPLPNLRLRSGHTLSMRVRLFMADDSSVPGSGYDADGSGPAANGEDRTTGTAGNGNDELEARQRGEDARRSEIFNRVQQASGSVRTLCRVRPRNEQEVAANEDLADFNAEGNRISLPNKLGERKSYEFNHVFGPDAADSLVLEQAWESTQKALGGTDTTVIWYGQTGSGKSYLTDRLVEHLSSVLFDGDGLPVCGLRGTWVEVYDDKPKDLLSPQNAAPKLKLVRDGGEWKHNAFAKPLSSLDCFRQTHDSAARRRTTSKTKVNAVSSRSHSVMTLFISGTGRVGAESRLQLVDLAGSEELCSGQDGLGEKDKAEVERQKREARAIKTSLTNLGMVVRGAEEAKRRGSRHEGASRVFPDALTKITGPMIVKPGTETLMIFTLSPLQAHNGKSHHTLQLADEILGVYLKTAGVAARLK